MKKILLICIGAMLVTSCTDFLEEKPKSSMAVETFFAKPEHAYSAVNLLYRRGVTDFGQSNYWSCPIFGMGPFMSGYFDSPYKGQERFFKDATELNLNPIDNSDKLDDIWRSCYSAIFQANLCVERIPTTPGLLDAERNKLLAEAKFFRAYNYFHLVKTFGEVPLVTSTTDLNYIVPKTAVSDVYSLIVSDLKFATEQGGMQNVPMNKNGFRVSKGSVDVLLADVYLTMSGKAVNVDKYAEAAAVAREIINSNAYHLITNVNTTTGSAFNTMRTSDIQNEYLYQIEFEPGIKTNALGMACYPKSLVTVIKDNGYVYEETVPVFTPTPQFLAIYNKAEDIRIQDRQFFHSSFIVKESRTVNGTTYTKGQVFPFENGQMLPYLWHDDNAMFGTGQSGQDMIVYRYAEVLLIAAEAIAQKEGVTDEAASYLAQVRSRASLTGKTVNDIKVGLLALGKQAFIEEVWKEKLREFPLEWKIWNDMLRTGKFPKTDVANPGVVTFQELLGSTNTFGNSFKQKDFLFPISQSEIQRNPKLTQNTGY